MQEHNWENNGDDADLAQNEIYLNEKIQRERASNAIDPKNQLNFDEFDGTHCVDCGEEIPLVRREKQYCRCILCQEALEHQNKLYGR